MNNQPHLQHKTLIERYESRIGKKYNNNRLDMLRDTLDMLDKVDSALLEVDTRLVVVLLMLKEAGREKSVLFNLINGAHKEAMAHIKEEVDDEASTDIQRS